MNTSTPQPNSTDPVDPDLAEQAVPGHGIPSQDPDPAAQVGLIPEEAERESKSALMGGGLVAGSAAGAAIGAVVAGPVGVLVGVTLGAVTGALGGAGAGKLVSSENTAIDGAISKESEEPHREVPPR